MSNTIITTSSNNNNKQIFSLILAESEAVDIGNWVRDVVVESLSPPIQRVILFNIDTSIKSTSQESAILDKENNNNSDNDGKFCLAVKQALDEAAVTENNNNDNNNNNRGVKLESIICLIIAVFWDGQTEASKAEFIQLRKLTNDENNTNNNYIKLSNFYKDVKIHFIVQALNAKKGTHTLKENREALVNSLRKKIPDTSPERHVDPCNPCTTNSNSTTTTHSKLQNTSSSSNSLSTTTTTSQEKSLFLGTEDLSEAGISKSVEDGQGECFIIVTGKAMEEFQQRLLQLQTSTKSIGAGCIPVMDEPREVQANNNNNNNSSKTKIIAQEFLIRQSESLPHFELRLAMCGNVDSGKSTLTSVLTRGCRDDGRGSARAFVFKHKHEITTGRTSSVSENHLGLSSTGEVVNYTVAALKRFGHNNNNHNNNNINIGGGASSWQISQEVAAKSSKVLTLYDLAGHERYLKTTVLGMTRNMPDYACVVISANNGIQRMTKEHLALCLALKIPFFIVVTRIDSTPDNVRQETLTNIHKLLKIPTVRKMPCPVRFNDDIVLFAKNLRNDRIAPIFEVSNVTGVGINELVKFLNLLPMRKDWRKARIQPKEMIIDSTFFVTGVGTVVGGIITQGVFHTNDSVLLGPDSHGAYRTVHIKSIHVKGVEQTEASAGCDAAFCLKKEKRSAIRKGNILIDPQIPVKAYWQFEADVIILYHSTTILVNYEPVIHSTTVRQSARIVYVAQEVLRTGDRSLVRFHFLYRPEFMKVGQQLVFREGRTKGIGTVTNVIITSEPSLLGKKKVH